MRILLVGYHGHTFLLGSGILEQYPTDAVAFSKKRVNIFQPSGISTGLKNGYNRNRGNTSYPRGATVAKS